MKNLLQSAVKDLKSAKRLLLKQSSDEKETLAVTAYHLHQSIEKSLKFLIGNKNAEYPDTHDILQLIHVCTDNGIEAPSYIEEHTVKINAWATGDGYNPTLITDVNILRKVASVMEKYVGSILKDELKTN